MSWKVEGYTHTSAVWWIMRQIFTVHASTCERHFGTAVYCLYNVKCVVIKEVAQSCISHFLVFLPFALWQTNPIWSCSDTKGWAEVALPLHPPLGSSWAVHPTPLHHRGDSSPLPLHQSPGLLQLPQSHCQLLSQSAAAQQHQAWQSLTLLPSSLSTLCLSNYCHHIQQGREKGVGK